MASYSSGKMGYVRIGSDLNKWSYFDTLDSVGADQVVLVAFGYVWVMGGKDKNLYCDFLFLFPNLFLIGPSFFRMRALSFNRHD